MAAPLKIVLTLTGSLEGQTIVLNDRQFIDGVFTTIASDDDCAGLARYFSASYNCDVWRGMHNEEPPQPVITQIVLDEVLAVDPETEVDASEEVEETPEPEQVGPDARTQDLIEAINMIEDKWVDDVVPHPSVAKVAEIMEDSTVTKEEIVAAVERFNLVDDSPESKE